MNTSIQYLTEHLTMPSPVHQVTHPLLTKHEVRLYVKREDLIHPEVSGNKWRKLNGHLDYVFQNKIETIVTFGGAFSNHIAATAAACHMCGLSSIGIIRGEEDVLNPTLFKAISDGMRIEYVSRSAYQDKEQSDEVKSILSQIANFHLVPEGGSAHHALIGLATLTTEIETTDCDVVLVSAGTGCTAGGIHRNLSENKALWVFSALKGGFMKDQILQWSSKDSSNLKIIQDYHMGGYAKTNEAYITFVNDFINTTGIDIDPIYNGKLIYGFLDMVKRGVIDPSKKYMWIHTGGLQGIAAYNYRAEKGGRKKKMVMNSAK